MKLTKIYPRDIIALVVLLFSLTLISLGINSLVSGIVIMIITFYFSRRINGEGEPDKDINQKVQRLEEEIKTIPKAPNLNIETTPRPPIKHIPQTTGDFKVLSK